MFYLYLKRTVSITRIRFFPYTGSQINLLSNARLTLSIILLHQSQYQGLLAALLTAKKLCGEMAIPCPRQR